MVEFRKQHPKMIKAFIHRFTFQIPKEKRSYTMIEMRQGNVFFVDNDEHTTTDGKRFTAKVKWFYAQSE
jgi:hypothetical protein